MIQKADEEDDIYWVQHPANPTGKITTRFPSSILYRLKLVHTFTNDDWWCGGPESSDSGIKRCWPAPSKQLDRPWPLSSSGYFFPALTWCENLIHYQQNPTFSNVRTRKHKGYGLISRRGEREDAERGHPGGEGGEGRSFFSGPNASWVRAILDHLPGGLSSLRLPKRLLDRTPPPRIGSGWAETKFLNRKIMISRKKISRTKSAPAGLKITILFPISSHLIFLSEAEFKRLPSDPSNGDSLFPAWFTFFAFLRTCKSRSGQKHLT